MINSQIKLMLRVAIISVIISLPGMSYKAVAQQKIDPTLEVRREFDGRLTEIQKSRLNTNFADTIANFNLNFNYSLFNKPVKDLYEFSPLPSAQIERRDKSKYPVFFADLGLQMPVNPHLDIFYQPNLPQGLSLILFGKHDSYLGKVPLENEMYLPVGGVNPKIAAPYYNNSIGTEFEYSWKKGKAGINFAFDNKLRSYYGFPAYQLEFDGIYPLLPITVLFPLKKAGEYTNKYMLDSLSHTSNTVGGGFFVMSVNPSPKAFNYMLEVDYKQLSDKANYTKNYTPDPLINIMPYTGMTEKYLNLKADFGPGFGEYHKFLVGVNFETANSRFSTTMDRRNLTVNPRYLFTQNRWIFEAGVKINKWWEPNNEGFNIFFKGTASIELIKDNLWFYAGLDGDNKFLTYRDLLSTNPWAAPSSPVKNIKIPIAAKLGFKGQVADRFSYHVWGGYTKFRDQIFFSTYDDTALYGIRNAFLASYAGQEKINAGAEMSWKSKDFEGGLSAEYNYYTRTDSIPSYHYAPFELKAFARYSWRERLIFEADLAYRSKTPALPKGVTPAKPNGTNEYFIKSFALIDLNATYVYNKRFSFYLKINNLLNAQESYFTNYKGIGINAGGGVIITL